MSSSIETATPSIHTGIDSGFGFSFDVTLYREYSFEFSLNPSSSFVFTLYIQICDLGDRRLVFGVYCGRLSSSVLLFHSYGTLNFYIDI